MSKLLPYETIVKAHEGDPEAIDTVLSHYAGYIRYCSKVHGKVNAEVEEYVKQRLPLAIFPRKFTIHLFPKVAGHSIMKPTTNWIFSRRIYNEMYKMS